MPRINHNGYIEIRKPDHHRARGNGYVFEHIVIMEQKLNRPISIKEEVHHIDGNKQNNHPDNLMIMNKTEHAKETARIRREKNMLPCVECGKKVYRKPYQQKHHKYVFCSSHCCGKWGYKNNKGVFSIDK